MEVKNKSVGRPKKDNNRKHQVKALLTKEEFETLENYCLNNDISKSKVISNFINKYLINEVSEVKEVVSEEVKEVIVEEKDIKNIFENILNK